MFSVVIPSKNSQNVLIAVRSILRRENVIQRSGAMQIIVVDDGLKEHPAAIEDYVTYVEGTKPFVFAKNVNLGVSAADPAADLVIMNDDAVLQTDYGLTALAAAVAHHLEFGVISAGVVGAACNPRVLTVRHPYKSVDFAVMPAPPMVPFICVGIRRAVYNEVGGLDERYVDYGFDDDDFCRSVRRRGLGIGVLKAVVVDHGELQSSFRGQFVDLEPNRARFVAKWGNHEGAA